MLSAYFAAALAGTWINYLELHLTGIGYYDLSINQQALSSTIHSNRPYPFYEAVNCGRDGRCSFLLVHPVFLAYAVAGPYAVFSSPFTLFAIQDLALALAAVPLYAIARIVSESNRLSLVIVGAYLVWLPAFTGIFSFHWEAFIPLEFFLIFWLWLTDRYLLSVPVVILSFITLEVMAILLFFLAVFFLLSWALPFVKLLRLEVPRLARGDVPLAEPVRAMLSRIRGALQTSSRLRASIYLLVGSALAYLLLHEFVTTGGALLGLPVLPAKYVIPLTRPVYAALFTVGNLQTAWQSKLVFWLVIYGTLAMVPMLAPRTLVLAAPWIILSLFATSGYYRMGDQYAFVSAALLFIGFTYGLTQLKKWAETVPVAEKKAEGTNAEAEALLRRTQSLLEELRKFGVAPPPPTDAATTVDATPTASGAPPTPAWEETPAPSVAVVNRWWARRRRVARVSLAVIVVAVIGFNLFLNPFNPLSDPLKADRPFVPQSSLGLDGGVDMTDYHHIESIVSMMGSKSIVAVSPMLFTFVANDPYAYPLLAGMVFPLPFNVSYTQYVLLLDRGGTTFAAPLLSLRAAIYNPYEFGVRAWIPTTYVGGVLLFQRGYTGATQVLGTAPGFQDGVFSSGYGLETGKAGVSATDANSHSGTVIETTPDPNLPGSSLTGKVFFGPGVTLWGGSYNVTVVLRGLTNASSEPSDTPVVTLDLSGLQDPISTEVLTVANLSGSGWHYFNYTVSAPYPILEFTVSGSNRHGWFGFQLDSVAITPAAGP